MSSGRIACAYCQRSLPPDFSETGEFLACPGCNQRLRAFTFPALHHQFAPAAAAPAADVGQASCFYHSAKQAVVACDSCGRFLCALCDVEIGSSHTCPACLEAGKQKRKVATLETRRTLYDGLALAVAVVPILMWPVTLLTAPAALFLVIWHWRKPLSVLPRTRIRFVLAALIALAQIFGWIVLFYWIFGNMRRAA